MYFAKVRFVTIVSLLCVFATSVFAQSKETQKVRDAIEVFEEIKNIPEKGIPESLMEEASAVIIVPKLVKAGFVAGGQYGKGIAMVKEDGGWSNPIFVSLAGGSFGLQIGASSTDIILVVRNSDVFDNIMKQKFTLGGDASIAAGPVGRRATASIDEKLDAEIFSYSRSKGLFAGVSLDGTVIDVHNESNDNFYDASNTTPQKIFKGKYDSPSVVKELKKIMD